MFDQVMARIGVRFGRVEPRAAARAYLLGLLASVEWKDCRQLAEQVGHARPGPMQRLLRYARGHSRRPPARHYSYTVHGTGCRFVSDNGTEADLDVATDGSEIFDLWRLRLRLRLVRAQPARAS
ncbi:DUF6896 domain-containing protein [Streptomyces globisporus]|uniref:DUF6896 domain-containing protein n=1 Tax=Streptomyces globisporus TaxID=1908 RepID=UPI0037A65E4A